MVTELIAVAVITGGCSVFGQIIIAKSTAKTHSAVTDIRLGTIETKMDKHNNFMERVAVLEGSNETVLNMLKEIKENCKETRRECAIRNDKV